MNAHDRYLSPDDADQCQQCGDEMPTHWPYSVCGDCRSDHKADNPEEYEDERE